MQRLGLYSVPLLLPSRSRLLFFLLFFSLAVSQVDSILSLSCRRLLCPAVVGLSVLTEFLLLSELLDQERWRER